MAIITETVKIPAHDGGAFAAYVARPDTEDDVPGIVVIQEIFGVNSDMRAKCDELAGQGYVAVCPDLFWRIEEGVELVDSEPAQLERAFELFGLFNELQGLDDLKTTLGYVRHHGACNEKVGTLGYCLGGKLAYMMACHSNADANVAYYGVTIDTLLHESEGIDAPLLMHMAEKDEFVDGEAQEKIKAHFKNRNLVAIHSYADMDHAFARENGMHFDKEAANLANGRTAEFLKEYLAA